jgi:ATP-binding cassette subfamily B protein
MQAGDGAGVALAVARPGTARSEAQVVRDLLPFLKPFTGRICLALALVVAGKLANLAVPMLLKKLVDGLSLPPSQLVLPAGLLIAYGASSRATSSAAAARSRTCWTGRCTRSCRRSWR